MTRGREGGPGPVSARAVLPGVWLHFRDDDCRVPRSEVKSQRKQLSRASARRLRSTRLLSAGRGLAELRSEPHACDARSVGSAVPTVTPDLRLTLAVRRNYPRFPDKETEAQVMNVSGQNGPGRERRAEQETDPDRLNFYSTTDVQGDRSSRKMEDAVQATGPQADSFAKCRSVSKLRSVKQYVY